MTETNSSTARIGQTYRLKDLKGWLTKHLEVPQGHQGIVIDAEGGAQTYPPGIHKVITGSRRMTGKGAGFRAGVIASSPLALVADTSHLLSGDGQLLDVSLGLVLEVADPVLAFKSAQVAEDGSLLAETDRESLWRVLQPMLRQYTAQDLAVNLPGDRLLAEILPRMDGLTAGSGLRTQAIRWLAVTPADERVKIAEKLQQLEEKLKDVELEKRLAEAESEAELRSYLGEVQPGLDQVGVRVTSAGPAQGEKPFNRWRAGLRGAAQKGKERPAHILKQLFKKKPDETTSPSRVERPRIPRRWWWNIAMTMLLFLAIGMALTYLVKILTEGAPRASQLEILLAIWTVVVAIELDAAKRLYEKREALAEALWMHPDKSHLDILARNNRQQADTLVRKQASTVFQSIQDKFEDSQSRVFAGGQGDTNLAMKVRDLRRKIADLQGKIQDRAFGVPAYMTDLNVTWPAWLSMLDYDEDLLLQVNALDEEAFQLQEKVAVKGLTPEMLDEFEQDMDHYIHRFAARGRAVKE